MRVVGKVNAIHEFGDYDSFNNYEDSRDSRTCMGYIQSANYQSVATNIGGIFLRLEWSKADTKRSRSDQMVR